MKKSITSLLVLLFLLIVTCVYQKTSELNIKYAEHHTSPKDSTDHISVLPAQHTMQTENIEKIKKIQEEAIKAVIIKTKKETHVSKKAKSIPQISMKTLPSIQKDIEEIDTLMRALKERKVAFENRAKYEAHLQHLITKALENRSLAIAYMNKEGLRLLELQSELLNTRDVTYNQIAHTNTPTSGE